MLLISIDPGLDITGYAVWDPSKLTKGLTIEARVAPALLEWGRIETDTEGDITQRLRTIVSYLCWWLAANTHRPTTTILVERPAARSVYARHEKGARNPAAAIAEGLEKMHYAAAALICAAHQAGASHVLFQRADRTPKPRKQAIARRIIAASTLPGTHVEDERDAIYLGATYLQSAAYVKTLQRKEVAV